MHGLRSLSATPAEPWDQPRNLDSVDAPPQLLRGLFCRRCIGRGTAHSLAGGRSPHARCASHRQRPSVAGSKWGGPTVMVMKARTGSFLAKISNKSVFSAQTASARRNERRYVQPSKSIATRPPHLPNVFCLKAGRTKAIELNISKRN